MRSLCEQRDGGDERSGQPRFGALGKEDVRDGAVCGVVEVGVRNDRACKDRCHVLAKHC